MSIHSNALHHHHVRKRIYQKLEPYPHPDKLKRVFDRLIYAVVILGPIMNIPQLVKIWGQKNAQGVSALSWTSFTLFSIVWLIYGILHKDKPLICMNVALMIMQALIALGAFLYG